MKSGLVRMKRYYDEGEFDVLIIDSAPTVLLCDVELTGSKWWYMRRLQNYFKNVSRARPLVGAFFF